MDRELVTGALMRRYPTHGIDAMSQDELISLLCGLSTELLQRVWNRVHPLSCIPSYQVVADADDQ